MTTIDAEARDALIDALSAYPGVLEALLEGRDEEDLVRAGPDASWGVVEVLCHLRDTEEVSIERFDLMLTEDAPPLPTIEHTLWPIDRDYINQDPGAVLETFSEYRRRMTDRLDEIDIGDWGRVGQHPQEGLITIREYAEQIVDHDEEHRLQILAALREVGE